MVKAKEYEYDYWDGDRRYGYGGYRNDGRWKPIAQKLIAMYGLKLDAKVLDVGCGKGFLLYELQQLLTEGEVRGFDISKHGIGDAPEALRPQLSIARAQDPYPWPDDYFDLVISLNCLHNLMLPDLKPAFVEMERVGKQKYMLTESYRDEQELFNLQCWVLTGHQFLHPSEWTWLMDDVGYTGDYEFIYFE
jgi:ubiquinone/menaquinone biosynthesis C-methylase UbiE